MPDPELKMKQLLAAQWEGARGNTYSIIALGEDGYVYRFDAKCHGWIRYPMVPADCGLEGHVH